jgi:hypothetical protein
MSAAAMANWAAGSSGVGPGVKRRVLRIIDLASEIYYGPPIKALPIEIT